MSPSRLGSVAEEDAMRSRFRSAEERGGLRSRRRAMAPRLGEEGVEMASTGESGARAVDTVVRVGENE